MIPKLDKIDLKILKELQSEGNITNKELAKRVGISPPPCLRRVNNLEKAGIITSYHATVNPYSMGYTVTIFCEVGLHSQNEHELKLFEETTQNWPMVRECYLITGGLDFLLKVVAHDFDEYQQFMTKDLGALSLVSQIKTRMVIRVGKNSPGIPLLS